MNILNARIHGFFDVVTIVVFALAPLLFGLGGTVAVVCWVLSAAHLVLTLLTRFPLGVVKAIPFPVHGLVAIAVGLVLVLAMPRLLGAGPGSPARTFFVDMGVVILAVWALTRYRDPQL